MVILALCKVQTVSFHKLALAFDCESKADSSLRRLQRFIAEFTMCGDLIARLIFGLLPRKTNLKLVIDRTNLNREGIRYYLRIRNNFKVYLPRKNAQIPVSWLFSDLAVGEIRHYHRIVKVNGEYCYISATMSQKRGGKPELLIIISYNKNEQSFLNYKERWQIETCFRAMKSSGFDIENTHLKELERIEKLPYLVMIAFVWCYLLGDYLDKNVKAIIIKKHGHRAKSVFKYGLEYISNCLLNHCRKEFQKILDKIVM